MSTAMQRAPDLDRDGAGRDPANPATTLGLRLDTDDYRPLQPTRWAQPYPSRAVLALTVAGALLTGFLLAVGITNGRSQAEVLDARNAELVELIGLRQAHVDTLSAQLEELRGSVTRAEEAITGPTSLRSAVTRAEQQAGLSAMRGPGLRLSLADGTGTCRGERPQDCRIQDTDLQLAINTLFGIGAEAVAVNGERVIATTAVRNAGGAILVNYRVLTPPYVVEAIGDPDVLARELARSGFARDFEAWKPVYGLGFAHEPADALTLPGFGGSVRFQRAVVEGAGA
jgi:uncharacterized protein YlxW (UPF0749 family)